MKNLILPDNVGNKRKVSGQTVDHLTHTHYSKIPKGC